MKIPLLHLLSLYLSWWNVSAQDPSKGFRILDLPEISMQLVFDKPDVNPAPFQWPLVATTSVHLTSYIEMVLKGGTSDYSSSLKISLNPSLQIDEDAISSFPNGTVIKATFEGEIYFNKNYADTMVSQSLVNSMVNEAFKGSPFNDLFANFKDDSTLQQVDDLKVWVTLPTSKEVNTAPHEATERGEHSNSNSSGPIKIAAGTCVVSLVIIGSVSMYAYLRRQKDGKDCDDGSTSVESTEEEASMFSTEYWKDAWAQAAGQIKPKPTRRQRQFKRHPSSIRPNLDSIQEGEEEDDWEDSAWTGDNPIESLSIWHTPAVMEATGEQTMDKVDEKGVSSPTSSEGSFFTDEDPEIAMDTPNSKPFMKKERQLSSRSFRRKERDVSVADEIAVMRNQILSKTKPKKAVEAEPKVDELTAVRNRILTKKKEQEEEVPVVDELTMVRNRVLSKSSHGTQEEDFII